MTNKTTIQRILDLITERPGLRSVEIESALDIENVNARLASAILQGKILATDVQAPNGRIVRAYRINPDYEEHRKGNVEKPVQRVVSAVKTDKPAPPVAQVSGADGLVAALFTTGELQIEVGRKSVRLTGDQTRELIAYLGRSNVDQVLGCVRAV